MIVLTFLACLATGPVRCETLELDAPSLMACQVQGQQGIVDWLAQNRAYRLGEPRWRCVVGRAT